MIKKKMIRNINREFLYTVMRKQITNCIVNENYKSCVYTSNISNLETISDLLKTIIKKYLCVIYSSRKIRLMMK